VKFRTWISKITLGALALGAFFSCGPKQPQDPYPQDRVVGIVGYPVPSNLDSTWLAANPDSSGWKLHWTRPSDTTANAIYIFSDSLPGAKSKLANGNGNLDPTLQSRFAAKLSAKDTSWQIPSRFLEGRQGKSLSTQNRYYFSIWARYDNGPVADAPWVMLFVGDDIPPQLPFVLDSAGQTTAVLKFARPRDPTSNYDTLSKGPLSSVRALYWPGSTFRDSAGKVSYVEVSQQILKETTVDSFRLTIPSLNYYTSYCYALEVVDTAGNMSRSPAVSFTTLDKFPPAAPSNLQDTFHRSDFSVFTWSAASDTFQNDPASRKSFPNYRIQRYVVRVNGQRIDSAVLDPAVESFSGDAARDTSVGGRFQWLGASGSVWTWTWRSFRPGKPYLVDLIAYDLSGNAADSVTSLSVVGTPRLVPPGPCDPGWVGVQSDSSGLNNFCIEEHEHASGGKVATRTTWAGAEASCQAVQAHLCSEAQWIYACERFPDTAVTANYGAVEAGMGTNGDTLSWLKQHCQVGTGDSVAMVDPTNTDPRCVSGWGVFDMPGRVGEWTRDVFFSTPDSISVANREAGTLAYLGVSDLTGQADLGTIHGGSALLLDQVDRTLASATCHERNYPATSAVDTLPSGMTRVHPFPQGMSSAWGFRCCKPLP